MTPPFDIVYIFKVYSIVSVFSICLNSCSSTRLLSEKALTGQKLILGLNKYSHDASVCIVDASAGNILFAQAKERISRKKHDGGSVGSLVQYALDYVGASINDVSLVVSNNHHYRVLPFEKRAPFASSLGYIPKSYLDDSNLLPLARHMELSHHLAHAYSVTASCPFKSGLVLCMDGMGESYRSMAEHMASSGAGSEVDDYMHDLKLLRSLKDEEIKRFVGVPHSLIPGAGYREAESAYIFENAGSRVVPIFKRWCRERSPSELYNHGFENMDSMGAVYSRISSYILGDWNSCGKIMGLAPWDNKKRQQLTDWLQTKAEGVSLGTDFHHKIKLMSGNPFIDSQTSSEGFNVNWDVVESLPNPNEFSESRFSYLANVAASVQQDLETSVMSLLSSLKERTEERNLVLVGGVALNSVLNGRIRKESGFNVYVPPGPGDEGVAVGCAIYGYQRLQEEERSRELSTPASDTSKVISFSDSSTANTSSDQPVSVAMSAYQGCEYTDELIELALYEYTPWLNDVLKHPDPTSVVEAASAALEKGESIAWFQGRSEFGQRALGSRSILGDPRSKSVRLHINQNIKSREWWRPLAPAVMAEHAGEWFEFDDTTDPNVSPFMSITLQVKEDKVDKVPAVCHIDNSARLQTVSPADAPLFHALINAFYRRTGTPMVLNTSFNRNSEPIVESPEDAVRSFLASHGHIKRMFIGSFEVSLKEFNSTVLRDASTTFVFAQPVYLSEVVTSINSQGSKNDSSGQAVRIRVQTGQAEDTAEGDVDSESGWLTLPSQMHLEILQLLQVAPASEEDGEQQSGICVSELRAILVDVYVSEDDDDEVTESTFESNFSSSMKWLYEQQLIYFEEE